MCLKEKSDESQLNTGRLWYISHPKQQAEHKGDEEERVCRVEWIMSVRADL